MESIFKIQKVYKWDKEEDHQLLSLIEPQKRISWKEVSNHFFKKSPYECQKRYNKIREDITKGFWTDEEDEKLLMLIKKYGKCWSKIGKYFRGRTSKQIRERYSNYLNPDVSNDKFTIYEDITIYNLFKNFGTNWKVYPLYLKNRSADRIKNRYNSSIRGKLSTKEYLRLNSDGSTEVKTAYFKTN